jgi:hypothetical protein
MGRKVAEVKVMKDDSTDDITGKPCAESDLQDVKIKIGTKTYDVAITADTLDGLTAMMDGGGPAAWGPMLGARKATVNPESARVRAWALSTGWTDEKGKPVAANHGAIPGAARVAWVAAGSPDLTGDAGAEGAGDGAQ